MSAKIALVAVVQQSSQRVTKDQHMMFVFKARDSNKLVDLNLHRETWRKMNLELKRRLQREFAPEVERLSELLGRDLAHWSTD